MRPLKLVMSAFGPFGDEETIDFTKMGSSGLYLVTGDTGAGKTTIFDAISYGLYGAPSGEYRDGKMFRSKYAKLETITFVELTFETHGKEYVVKRIPEQRRAKMRGEGEAQQKAEAVLTFSDGRQPLTKIQEVDDAIRQIVGLNQKQFSQITMLAQGEFRKLLLSTTDEKQKIFRDIFATEEYRVLQAKLKDMNLEMKKEYDRTKDHILRDIASLECGEDFSGKEELEEFCGHNQLVGKEQVEHLVGDLLRVDEACLQKFEEELGGTETSLQQLNARIGVASERQKAVSQMQMVEKELEELNGGLKKREQSVQEAEQQMREVETLNAEVVRIEAKLEDYSQYDTLKKAVEKKQQELVAIEKQQEKHNDKINQLAQEEKQLTEMIEMQKDAEVKALECQQNLTSLTERKEAVTLLIKDYETESKLCKSCEKEEQAYKKSSEAFEQLAKNLVDHEKLFLDAQAGVLARGLEKGKPCPVCGSLEHPQPAKAVEEVVTREALDEERACVEQAREQCQGLVTNLTRMKEQLAQHQNQYASQLKKLFGVDTMDFTELVQQKETVETQLDDMKLCLTKWQTAKKQREQAMEQLPQVQSTIKQLNEQMNLAEQEKVACQTEVKNLLGQLEQLRSGLGFESVEDAKKTLEQLRLKAGNILQEQKEATRLLQELKQDISTKEGQRESLEKMLQEQSAENLDTLLEQRTQLMNEKQQKETGKSQVYARYQKNCGIAHQVSEQWDAFQSFEERYVAVKRISDTVNGELSGQDKVKLETYILMAYFERVLQKANVRLLGMTAGQYELVRSLQADNQKSQSGLDINVYDHYTASERSVKSLSGGETFMASLALALGLADEIQSAAGGIHMDTLFVDEGFGSLDDDTLKRAMAELQKLTEGNRLVGMISHVADLKNWIDRQIVVKKEAHEGSKVEMIL